MKQLEESEGTISERVKFDYEVRKSADESAVEATG